MKPCANGNPNICVAEGCYGEACVTNKKVPVYVGEGLDRIEIGRAGVDTLADGTTMVNISIEDVQWGGWTIGGFFPLRLTGIIPINHLERRPVMPAAEDRQAKALEQIAHSLKELTKVAAKANENLVGMFTYIKKQIEEDNATIAEYNPAAEMSIDELRARAEELHEQEQARRHTGEHFTIYEEQLQYDRDAKDRDERREYEERTGEVLSESDLEQRKIAMQGMSPPNWQIGALVKVIDPKSPRFGAEGVVTKLHATCVDLDFGLSGGDFDYYKVALVSNTTIEERSGEADPIQDKITSIDVDANKVEHTSEFNNPEHRPPSFKFGEGSE